MFTTSAGQRRRTLQRSILALGFWGILNHGLGAHYRATAQAQPAAGQPTAAPPAAPQPATPQPAAPQPAAPSGSPAAAKPAPVKANAVASPAQASSTAGRAQALISQLRLHAPQGAALDALTRAQAALTRATQAANQAELRAALEACALEWANVAAEAVRLLERERAAQRVEEGVSKLTSEIAHARALLEETQARRGRAQGQLNQLQLAPTVLPPAAGTAAKPAPAGTASSKPAAPSKPTAAPKPTSAEAYPQPAPKKPSAP